MRERPYGIDRLLVVVNDGDKFRCGRGDVLFAVLAVDRDKKIRLIRVERLIVDRDLELFYHDEQVALADLVPAPVNELYSLLVLLEIPL